MEVQAVSAAVALQQELLRINGDIAAAEAALQAARTASAVPKPAVQSIGPGELETARLSDLAGMTEGKVAELEATKAAEAQALTSWKTANAAAVAEIARQEAAIVFHKKTLRECEKLQVVAVSNAAQTRVEEAKETYRVAFEALKQAAADLIAIKAIGGGASKQRMIDTLPEEHRWESPFSIYPADAVQIKAPALEAMRATSADATVFSKDDLAKLADGRKQQFLDVMKGVTQ